VVLKVDNLESVVNKFMSKYYVKADDRYASFDYCYNYFRVTEDLTKDIEKSCLVLGFYLASWGMFRGSSFLLQKNVKHFEKTITYISGLNKTVWEIDVDKYSLESMKTIKQIYTEIKKRLVPDKNAHLTLVTKTLLGVFGFVPAFDNYFSNTFRKLAKGQYGFRTLNLNSLHFVKSFYEANKESIDNLSKQNFTIDFTGEKTKINYTKAKIIDMYGFTIGLTESEDQS